jgi:hypothetical protein
MNEFLLLAVIVVYLAIKPPPQRADEEITVSRPQKESSEVSRTSSYVPFETRITNEEGRRSEIISYGEN